MSLIHCFCLSKQDVLYVEIPLEGQEFKNSRIVTLLVIGIGCHATAPSIVKCQELHFNINILHVILICTAKVHFLSPMLCEIGGLFYGSTIIQC